MKHVRRVLISLLFFAIMGIRALTTSLMLDDLSLNRLYKKMSMMENGASMSLLKYVDTENPTYENEDLAEVSNSFFVGTVGSTLKGGLQCGALAFPLLYALGSNVAQVIDTEIYVQSNKNVQLTEEERETYTKIAKDGKASTVGMTREEKMKYIYNYRSLYPEIEKNWTEAAMLREFEYHDRGYELMLALGQDPNDESTEAFRFQHVDFESEQTMLTYLYRIIGNMFFW